MTRTVGPAGREAADSADPARHPAWLRWWLLALAAGQGGPGMWALLGPRSFYADFPVPGHPWVAMFPAYSEHLVRDFGALSLSLAVVLALAATGREYELVRAALVGCLVFAVAHLAFHACHLGRFRTVDVVAQLLSQVAPIAVAAGVLLRLRRQRGR